MPARTSTRQAKQQDPAAAPRGAGLASQFTESLHYDRRLFKEDIAGSAAHARMLGRQGIISKQDAEKIVSGLGQIEKEIEAGAFKWRPELEDIHMNIESRLYEVIGDAAGRLHTARSRNDQVATDTRLWVKKQATEAVTRLRLLQRAFVDVADGHGGLAGTQVSPTPAPAPGGHPSPSKGEGVWNVDAVLPGYTHMQRGQPVTLGHHMLAYFEMFGRDAARFAAARAAADVMPLGSGAMAGLPYPLDRASVAAELGFSHVSANSMDAVSDRDYMLEFIHAAAVCQVHLSRLGEELVIWSSEEFGFVRLPDEYTTGSSIMPQKRNPDFAELVRGKTGRILGHYVGLLTTLKGLPLTYNRDLQEDKEALFDAADTVLASLEAAAGMVRGARFDTARMRAAAEKSYVLATDIADYLVRKGVPFREAYITVAALSKQAKSAGKGFGELSLKDYQKASPKFAKDVMKITVDSAVAARDTPGGTAPGRVREALQDAYRRLSIAQQAGEW
ncbi:MAG: argininosuccinate lyase [Dehalococcoidia bacterium]|nr:argininosuccinate lyase [Dehalococcoidia bacterium]MSQ34316.1 argininosuccinate lyase [Dehalococcoidia bacterium]